MSVEEQKRISVELWKNKIEAQRSGFDFERKKQPMGTEFSWASRKRSERGWFWRRGFSSAGRAPALQAGGQRFDPANLHQTDKALRVDWSTGCESKRCFTESLRLKAREFTSCRRTLKTEHWILWCNYEKATVKEKIRVKIQFSLKKSYESLHNSAIKRTNYWTFLDLADQ